jgi:hypothetical protein
MNKPTPIEYRTTHYDLSAAGNERGANAELTGEAEKGWRIANVQYVGIKPTMHVLWERPASANPA